MPNGFVVSAAVEGIADEAVVRRLIEHAGGEIHAVYGKSGKDALRKKLSAYNNAAQNAPWLVLVDLNHTADCAPLLRQQWLPAPAPFICFCIAVRAIETWLLADADTIATFLGVARSEIPALPETLDDPKTTLVNLARISRRKDIRQDMVPREASGRAVGPAYTSRIVEYVKKHWRPDIAAQHSDSLQHTIDCLQRLSKKRRLLRYVSRKVTI